MVAAIMLSGCNLLEVRVDVAQRNIMDKGDGTTDNYTKTGDTKTDEETDKTVSVIKTIP